MWKRIVFVSVPLLGFALTGGGNPEVNAINQCLQFAGKARFDCLDKLYPEDSNITIYPPSNLRIRLAGRTSSIEKGKFNLKNQNIFLLSVDISNVILPISCNITTAKITNYGSNRVINMDVKDIRDKIILRDGDGKLLLEYTITK